MSNKILSCLLLFLTVSPLEAQDPQSSYENADSAWYDQLLYSGVEWRPTMYLVDGHEFFLTSEFIYGTVTINGITFKEVRMKYDIANDEIIVLWKSNFQVIIDSKKVDEFTVIHNGVKRRFINMGDKYPGMQGFAEVLYKGKSSVVARHTKTVARNPTHTHYEEFREDTRYYFIVNERCYQIRNRSSFLKPMGDYEAAVRKFIRQHKVFISIVYPKGFGIAAAYFDSLTGQKKSD